MLRGKSPLNWKTVFSWSEEGYAWEGVLWNKRDYTSSLERTTFESATKSSPRTSCLESADIEYRTSAYCYVRFSGLPMWYWLLCLQAFWSQLSTFSWKWSLFTIISTGAMTSHTPYMHILPCFKFQPVESIFSHHTTTLLSLFNLKMGKSKWRKERKHLGQIKAENLAILKLYQNGSRVFENKFFFFPLQTMTDSLKMFLETSLIHPHPFGKIVLVTLICGNLGSLSTDRIEYSFL